jgi:hypothetical protein
MPLPKSWSCRKVQSEFAASICMIWKAKILWKNRIFCLHITLKPEELYLNVADTVKEFDCGDEISRVRPAKKYLVIVKPSATKICEQKRLALSNLKEVFANLNQLLQK